MKATEIITKCDKIKPNVYSFSQKRDWLNKIETDIRLFVSRFSGTQADLSFAEQENPDLFLDDANDNVYIYYLISMIDLSNQEYALYNNSSSFFNASLLKWQKHHRRTHTPNCDISIKI